MHVGLGCSKTSRVFSAYCLYGFTNGHKVKAQAALTDQFFLAIRDEISVQPKGPVLIAGDFNADVQDLPTLQTFIQDMHYVDIGAVADTFGGKVAEPTCLAANSDAPTRRD